MAVVTAIASVVSGAISAVGAMQSANAQAQAAEYNAKVQERNAIIADNNRRLNIRQAEVAVEDKRRETRRTLSSIRAAYGNSGLDLAGSPLDVLEDTAIESELDAQRIEFQGRVANREGAIQVLGLQEDAQLNRMNAKNAKRAGGIAAAGAFIGGIGGAGQALSRVN